MISLIAFLLFFFFLFYSSFFFSSVTHIHFIKAKSKSREGESFQGRASLNFYLVIKSKNLFSLFIILQRILSNTAKQMQ